MTKATSHINKSGPLESRQLVGHLEEGNVGSIPYTTCQGKVQPCSQGLPSFYITNFVINPSWKHCWLASSFANNMPSHPRRTRLNLVIEDQEKQPDGLSLSWKTELYLATSKTIVQLAMEKTQGRRHSGRGKERLDQITGFQVSLGEEKGVPLNGEEKNQRWVMV